MTDSAPVQVPPAPPAAAAVFGERLRVATAYVDVLADTGITHGLLGPREVPRVWDRHVLNCAVVAELIEPEAVCADVGSGAGLPGLALAIARPDLTMHLIEPLQRRARWLETTIATLEVGNVTVHCDRAEALHGRVAVEVVTARAVADVLTLARWSIPLLPRGGRLLALKGATADAELTQALPALRRLGVTRASLRECGQGCLESPTRVMELVVAAAPSHPSHPRGPARSARRSRSRRAQTR